jgi:predicted DNA binding protein/CheY-like chemotaxis protein
VRKVTRNTVSILHVEDRPSDARLVRELLKGSPSTEFNLMHADRLDKALEMLRSKTPDAILLDLDLPDSHGLETLEKVRNSISNVPIIVCTSLSDEKVAFEAISRGAQDYLIKGDLDGRLLQHALNYSIGRYNAEHLAKKRTREEKAGEKVDQVVSCRIILSLPPGYPSYHAKVTANHPDLRFLVLERLEADNDTLVEDLKVTGESLGENLTDELRRATGTKSVELLEQSVNKLICLYRMTTQMTPFYRAVKELRVLIRFPIPIENSVARPLVISSRSKVRDLLEKMKTFAPDSTIQSIRTESISGVTDLLTPKQLEVFKLAMSSGYWDVPRRTTLTDLASMTNVAKSTIWETLAMIEKKLIRHAQDDYISSQSLS